MYERGEEAISELASAGDWVIGEAEAGKATETSGGRYGAVLKGGGRRAYQGNWVFYEHA